MDKFDINTAMFVMGMWTDEDGNRITDSEYNKILSASTWNEIDPNDLIIEEDHDRAEIDFREYIMGINL